MAQQKVIQSLFPTIPRDDYLVNDKGRIKSDWLLFFNQLEEALQTNFSNEGLKFPPLTATQIADIAAIYTPLVGNPLPLGTPDISGNTVFDTTNRVPKQFIITYDGDTPPNITGASWMTFTLT